LQSPLSLLENPVIEEMNEDDIKNKSLIEIPTFSTNSKLLKLKDNFILVAILNGRCANELRLVQLQKPSSSVYIIMPPNLF
jgi:hypothetical protein